MRLTMRLAYVAALTLACAATGMAQSRGDVCHVYVVDVEQAKKAWEMRDEKARDKALAGAETVFPEFITKVGEEETTLKTFPFPGGGLVITASVFYTDESMMSAASSDSMLLGVGVSPKPQDEWSPEHALAEVTYNDGTDTARVKKYVKAHGRSYLIGLECHVKPRRQAQ